MASHTIPRINRFDSSSLPQPAAVDAAWAAGLLEGEGCIRIQVCDVTDSRTQKRLKDRATMAVVLAMKDGRAVSRFGALFGAQVSERRDGMWSVTLSSYRAAWALDAMMPYLCGDKLPQAALAVEFQRGRVAGHRTPERHAWELGAAKRISEMKKVGVYGRRKGPASHIDSRIERSENGRQSGV